MFDIRINNDNDGKFIYLGGFIYALSNGYILTNDSRLRGSRSIDMRGFSYSWKGTGFTQDDPRYPYTVFYYDITDPIPDDVMVAIEQHFDAGLALSFSTFDDAMRMTGLYLDSFGSLSEEISRRVSSTTIDGGINNNNGSPIWIDCSPYGTTPETIDPVCFTIPGIIGDELYTGLHSYHSHDYGTLNSMAADMDGMLVGVELEVETNGSMLQDAFTECKSNFFYLETDSSIENYGVEVITVPLSPEKACDESTWDFTDFLNKHGASSYDTGRCGLHIHISKKAFGSNRHEIERTLFNVYTMYVNTLERYIPRIFLRDYVEYASNPDSGLTPKQKGIMYLYDDENIIIPDEIVDSVKDGISEYKSSRRYAINTNKEMTIEFRQGRGTLNKKSIVTMIEFVVLLVKFCRKNTLKYCTYNNFTNFVREKSKNKRLYERLLMRE